MSTPDTPAQVSVVVCTYNGARFVREQLESIRVQTLPPAEIIISDDGSTDETLEIVRNFQSTMAQSATPVRVFHREEALGPARNFWAALEEVNHELVALADQDDVWREDKLEVLGTHFADNPDVLLAHSDALLVGEQGATLGSLLHSLRATRGELRALATGRGLDALVKRNLVTGATVMLRAELIKRASPLPPGWMHDEWLALVAAAGGGLAFEPERLIAYRQHSSNQIGAQRITVSGAVARLRENQASFTARQAGRVEALAGLVHSSPPWLGKEAKAKLLEKIDHDQWRVALPPERLRRVVPVLRRLRQGNYHRFSRGFYDALRDVALEASSTETNTQA